MVSGLSRAWIVVASDGGWLCDSESLGRCLDDRAAAGRGLDDIDMGGEGLSDGGTDCMDLDDVDTAGE